MDDAVLVELEVLTELSLSDDAAAMANANAAANAAPPNRAPLDRPPKPVLLA